MSERHGRLLLLAGAFVGLALAAWDLSGVRSGVGDLELPPEAVAAVNGRVIARVAYERALRNVAAERRSGRLAEAERRHVLERMIDEELLIQAGLDMGLAGRDPNLRARLSAATIDLVTDLPAGTSPTRAALRDLYKERPEIGRSEPRLLLEVADFAADEAGRAAAVAARVGWLGGNAPPAGSAPLPATPVAAGALPGLLGASLTRAALRLEPGQVSEPVRGGSGWHLLRLIERRPGRAVPFEQARELLAAAWRKEAVEARLRTFLQARREAAHVQIRSAP